MKILQINAVYGISSTGRTTKELDEYMLSHGIESEVAVTASNCERDGIFIIGNKFDRKKHAFLSRLLGKQGYYSKKPTKELIEFIERQNPDVIHLRNLHGNYINMPMLLKFIEKKKTATVVTLHDFWLLTGKCVHFTAANCDKWQTQCENCPNLQNGNPTWFFDRTGQLFSDKLDLFGRIEKLAFVGVSQWTADEAEKSPICKNAIVRRIYNWIDFDKFYKKDASELKKRLVSENDFIILGVSAIWSERKGLSSFLELSKRLKDDEKIVLVGRLPDGVTLPENVICAGSVNSTKELSDYYNAADVLVNFSLEETFGKVSAEALSCGTPVVCYDSTANPELVGDGCGYVAEKNNFDEILEFIGEIKKNTKEFYSNKCIEYAHKNFSKDERIKDYINLYKELLEK